METDRARSTKVTDAKLAAMKLPKGKSEARTLIAPGLYLHLRQRVGGEVAKHWQFRAQVAGQRRWLSLGAYPAVKLAAASAELVMHQAAHQAAKKGDADHPVIAARFARAAVCDRPKTPESVGVVSRGGGIRMRR